MSLGSRVYKASAKKGMDKQFSDGCLWLMGCCSEPAQGFLSLAFTTLGFRGGSRVDFLNSRRTKRDTYFLWQFLLCRYSLGLEHHGTSTAMSIIGVMSN